MKCRHCENPNAIITRDTCCTGCDRLAQEGPNFGTGELEMIKTTKETEKDDMLPKELSVSFTIPYRLKSEANLREHWTQKHKRHQHEDGLIRLFMRNYTSVLPCFIQLIRIAPRRLDDDNLASAFKHIRDIIGDFIIPGMATGRADGDPRISWAYGQQQGEPRQYAIRIEIYT